MLKKGFLVIALIIYLFLFFPAPDLEAESIKTPGEKINYIRYSQNEDIAIFLSQVEHLSPELEVQIIGKTRETEEYGAKDLFLCIITEEGAGCPHKLSREKPTLLLIASQHGNEQSAKEAALWMIKDLAQGELKPLLKKLNFLIIPQANPYGNWSNQRANEQDLDLNRDHVKLETPEAEAIHRVFRTWMPEVTIDVHEKGDDYYRVSIGCVSNLNISPELQKFSQETILSEVEKKLQKKKITFHEYIVTQEMGINSSAGVRYRPEDVGKRKLMRRYSTADLNDGRNSLGIYETLSFIQEGASRHNIKTLKERTRWQYFGLRFFSESVSLHADKIKEMVSTLRQNLLEKARTFKEDDLIHLKMRYAKDPKQPTLTIKRFERVDSPIRGILRNDKKAGDPLTREDIAPYPYPSQYKVVEEVVKNWFPKVEPEISVARPVGYIIPSVHQDVIETLLHHGLNVEIFSNDSALEVEAYSVADMVPAEYDYLPPQAIEVVKKTVQVLVKRDDCYVCCAQDGANLIPCLLEPQSQYGLIRYRKYNLVTEKGDFFPIYRVVKKEDFPLLPYKQWKR